MMSPRWLPVFACLFLAFPSALIAAEKPNIVVILADDLGRGDLGCFGGTGAKTPHLDRLATEGIRFNQFYVNSPICSPSRTAITTGQYPQRWKITSFLSNRADNERRGLDQWLDPAAPSLARFLQKAGYATGHFGKWHMGGQRDVGEAPLIGAYGFDESLTNFEGLGPRLLGLADSHDGSPIKRHSLNSEKLGRGPVIWFDRTRLTSGFVGAAIPFINKAAAEGRPFYINLWPDDVHSPFYPPKERRGDGSKKALYHGVLETMDEQLGELFDHIRNTPHLKENTIVLFLSDNGHENGAGSAGPLRGSKGSLYEGGVRSPLIVWAPGLISPEKTGSTNDTSVFASFDLAPSLLSLTGTPSPQGIAFDGENLADVLTGKADSSRKEPVFWRRPPDRKTTAREEGGVLPDLAVRSGNWKLLCDYDGSSPQLHDLSADPGEATDLSETHPDIVADLTRKLVAWHQSMPADRGPEIGNNQLRRQR